MTYVVRQYEGHCMWEGTHPARANIQSSKHCMKPWHTERH